MTKGVKIALAAAIALFAVAVVASVIIFRPKEKNEGEPVWVEIVADGEVVERIDLASAEDRVFRVESGGGWNEIAIRDGEISVTDADCPDKTCVKTGVLRSEYVPIVCLPHKLIIRYAEG